MKKWILFLSIISLSTVVLAQETTKVSSDELLSMYRTWVKALLFVVVLLSIGLLVLGLKYVKIKQNQTDPSNQGKKYSAK
ncbi:MAG: hypothetical protein ABI207_01940 [Crocinitomicaceae bacterium]